MKWQAALEVDDDLIEGRDYIRGDNDIAARAFLDAAFETFELLGDFPEMGPRARLRSKKLRDLRFFCYTPAVQPLDRVLSRYRLRCWDCPRPAWKHELETRA